MAKVKVLKKVRFKFMVIKKDLDSRMSVCRQVVCSKIWGLRQRMLYIHRSEG